MGKLFLLTAFILSGCVGGQLVRADFNQSLEEYNDSIRWQEPDKTTPFISTSVAAEFKVRSEAAKNARLLDYQITAVSYDGKSNEASATVVFDYYVVSSPVVKKVTVTEKWAYVLEGGKKSWKIKTPPPDFR